MFRALRRNWDKRLFLFGLVVCAFGYGVAVGIERIFPYGLLIEIADTGQDVYANFGSYLGLAPTRHLHESHYGGDGVVVSEPQRMAEGVTMLAGYIDGGHAIEIVDAEGQLLHRWAVGLTDLPNIAEALPGRKTPQHDWQVLTQGAVLLANGDILNNFDYAGLVRLNACSEVLWMVPEPTHHSVALDDAGTIWVPSQVAHTSKDPQFPGISPPFYEDTILQVSQDGRTLREISILDILYRNGLESLLMLTTRLPDSKHFKPWDLTHLNDIEVLSVEMADAFPTFEAGDVLASFRSLNLIFVFDPETLAIKWYRIGPWIRQHDPDFLPDGRISVFDNRMESLGRSRIVIVDPATEEIEIPFANSEQVPFFSRTRGKHQYLPNGNILITEHNRGRAFEVTPDGQIVWSFVHRYDQKSVLGISQAERISLDMVPSTAECETRTN